MLLQVLFLESIVKQLSQDLSQTELQLKAAESDKAAADREHASSAQQALSQQVKALNARVSSEVFNSKNPCSSVIALASCV